MEGRALHLALAALAAAALAAAADAPPSHAATSAATPEGRLGVEHAEYVVDRHRHAVVRISGEISDTDAHYRRDVSIAVTRPDSVVIANTVTATREGLFELSLPVYHRFPAGIYTVAASVESKAVGEVEFRLAKAAPPAPPARGPGIDVMTDAGAYDAGSDVLATGAVEGHPDPAGIAVAIAVREEGGGRLVYVGQERPDGNGVFRHAVSTDGGAWEAGSRYRLSAIAAGHSAEAHFALRAVPDPAAAGLAGAGAGAAGSVAEGAAGLAEGAAEAAGSASEAAAEAAGAGARAAGSAADSAAKGAAGLAEGAAEAAGAGVEAAGPAAGSVAEGAAGLAEGAAEAAGSAAGSVAEGAAEAAGSAAGSVAEGAAEAAGSAAGSVAEGAAGLAEGAAEAAGSAAGSVAEGAAGLAEGAAEAAGSAAGSVAEGAAGLAEGAAEAAGSAAGSVAEGAAGLAEGAAGGPDAGEAAARAADPARSGPAGGNVYALVALPVILIAAAVPVVLYARRRKGAEPRRVSIDEEIRLGRERMLDGGAGAPGPGADPRAPGGSRRKGGRRRRAWRGR